MEDKPIVNGKYLMYRGKPLVREKNVICYGNMSDKYVLFMKNHFPSIFEGHNVSLIMAIGCAILFILIGIIVVTALALR